MHVHARVEFVHECLVHATRAAGLWHHSLQAEVVSREHFVSPAHRVHAKCVGQG